MKFFLFLLFLFSACTSPETPPSLFTEFKGEAMTMQWRIIIAPSPTEKEKHAIYASILEQFEQINRIYNKWNPHSEISCLNLLKANQRIPISQELQSFFYFVDRCVLLSGRRYDPTIEPLQALWKQKTPSSEELSLLLPAIGWDKVIHGKGYFLKKQTETKIDLSSVAKGYCIDLICHKLQEMGYCNSYVEWGGEIRASGQHPSRRPWQVFISNLGDSNPSHAVAIVPLKNQAIATSGDYLQNWTTADRKTTYFHLFDPQTGYPLKIHRNSVASVTVLAKSCVLADALATTAMLFITPESLKEWIVEIQTLYPDTAFWVVSRSGQIESYGPFL